MFYMQLNQEDHGAISYESTLEFETRKFVLKSKLLSLLGKP